MGCMKNLSGPRLVRVRASIQRRNDRRHVQVFYVRQQCRHRNSRLYAAVKSVLTDFAETAETVTPREKKGRFRTSAVPSLQHIARPSQPLPFHTSCK